MTDRYGKVVLTIIALALIWLCVGPLPTLWEVRAGKRVATHEREIARAAEKFRVRPGDLFIREMFAVGFIPLPDPAYPPGWRTREVEVWAVVLSGPSGPPKAFAVHLLRRASASYESDAVSVLDFDETLAAIDALVSVRNLATKMAGQDREFITVTYETADGLTLGFTQSGHEQVAFVEVGDTLSKKTMRTSMDSLGKINDLLRKAVTRLKGLGAKPAQRTQDEAPRGTRRGR